MHKYKIEQFKWDKQRGILSAHYTNLGFNRYDEYPKNIKVVGKYAVIDFRLHSEGKYVYNSVNKITNNMGFATHARFYDIELILETQ